METLTEVEPGKAAWLWADMVLDLINAGLDKDQLYIDPLSMSLGEAGNCTGSYDGATFILTWKPDFRMVSCFPAKMSIIDAFSKVFEKEPTMLYRDGPRVVAEWLK